MKKSRLYEIFRMLVIPFVILPLIVRAPGFPKALEGGIPGLSRQTILSSPLPESGTPVVQPFDPSRLSFREMVPGLSNPLFITHAGDGSGRLFVVERAGRIRIIKGGSLLSTPFLDIAASIKSTEGEQGLLALAFHPSYETNGRFFLAYTTPRTGDSAGSDLVLEEYSVSSGSPDQADLASGKVILSIPHPGYSNHNGGTLAFGQDGYVYWSTGDGGGGGDPNNNAQTLSSLLGKILRLDVDAGAPYQIPAGNPFSSSTDPNIEKEIWAYGLRNPWRISFDWLTHDLYIGDVGQGRREEIDFQAQDSAGGENYGWRIMEGSLCYLPANGCDKSDKILPVAGYDHTLGCSVTGGYVYRGASYPELAGYYFYGDFCTGRLFSLYRDPGTGWRATQIMDTPYQISTFGEDEQGELYLADYSTGKIYSMHYLPLSADTTGVFWPSNRALYLKNSNDTGFADLALNYGQGGDYPITGDWDGDGTDTIGVYRNGYFMLRNSNTIGFAEIVFGLGVAGDMPIAGNWDGLP